MDSEGHARINQTDEHRTRQPDASSSPTVYEEVAEQVLPAGFPRLSSLDARTLMLLRNIPALQNSVGNRAVARMVESPRASGPPQRMEPRSGQAVAPDHAAGRPWFQLKLDDGPAGDEYQQEVHQVAETAMRMPEPSTAGEKELPSPPSALVRWQMNPEEQAPVQMSLLERPTGTAAEPLQAHPLPGDTPEVTPQMPDWARQQPELGAAQAAGALLPAVAPPTMVTSGVAPGIVQRASGLARHLKKKASKERLPASGLARQSMTLPYGNEVKAYRNNKDNFEKPLEDLADFIMGKVNEMLMPPLAYPVKSDYSTSGPEGLFDRAYWWITINIAAFGKKGASKVKHLSMSEVGEIADTLYHEARHAEQWFRVARMKAGQLMKAGQKKIAKKIASPLKEGGLGIPEEVASEAVRHPLKSSSAGTRALITEAKGWAPYLSAKY